MYHKSLYVEMVPTCPLALTIVTAQKSWTFVGTLRYIACLCPCNLFFIQSLFTCLLSFFTLKCAYKHLAKCCYKCKNISLKCWMMYRNGSAKDQGLYICSKTAYNCNTMHNSIVVKDAGRGNSLRDILLTSWKFVVMIRQYVATEVNTCTCTCWSLIFCSDC